VGSAAIGASGGRSTHPSGVLHLFGRNGQAGLPPALTSISAPGCRFQAKLAGSPAHQRLALKYEFCQTNGRGQHRPILDLCNPASADIDARLAEIAFCCDELKTEGIVLLTTYGTGSRRSPFVPLLTNWSAGKPSSRAPYHLRLHGGTTPRPTVLHRVPARNDAKLIVSLWTSARSAAVPAVLSSFRTAGGLPYVAARDGAAESQLAETLPLLKRQYYDVALSRIRRCFAALTRFAGPLTNRIRHRLSIRRSWHHTATAKGARRTSAWRRRCGSDRQTECSRLIPHAT